MTGGSDAMDAVQRTLFGRFPRRVGTPSQHWVFNEAQVDLFLDIIDGVRGAYTTLNALPIWEGVPDVSDKVLFDFDSPAKDEVEGNGRRWDHPAIDPNEPADELIDRMRADPDLADAVLGQPVADARNLARESLSDGIPVLGVFSGFGIHVHQLYRQTTDPREAMASTAARYEDKAELDTMDWECVGQPEKLCRLPNVERATYAEGDYGQRLDGHPTGLWTVPLDAEDLRDLSVGELLSLSREPRSTDSLTIPTDDDRPQMVVWEGYTPDGTDDDSEVPQRPVDTATADLGDGIDDILHALLQMPCMAERIQQPNPENKVRLNCAVLLFNVGLEIPEVADLFAQLGWVDYDRSVTVSKLTHAWQTRYADMSCSSIQSDGYCVKDTPSDCSCHGWSGGQPEW